jgi:hypothetical protein
MWPGSVLLAMSLGLLGIGLLLVGRGLTHDIYLPTMGKIIGAVVVVIWAFSILIFLRINRDLARYTGYAGNLGPIFPVTLASAFCVFGYVAYKTRNGGALSSLGNGFLAFVAGPMVFELPFLLIVIPQVKAPLIPELIFLIPLFTIIFTTLAMLLFSRRVAITKNSIYLYAAMIFVFALWALNGYSYPSNSISFVLNGISKILGFASVAALFRTIPKERITDGERKIIQNSDESEASAVPN